jgi:ribosomal protein S18 acetylase RimI-like enzyme
MSIILRAANLSDLPALSSFAAECFSVNFGHLYEKQYLEAHLISTCSTEFFAKELAGGNRVMIATDAEKIVGYVKFGTMGLPIQASENAAEIHRLYVHGTVQYKGVGKRLMQSAIEQIHQQAVSEIYLGVWEENLRAQQFYRSFGFYPVGSYLYPVGPHRDKEIIMRRDFSVNQQIRNTCP